MSGVPAQFLFMAESLEQACIACNIPEEEIAFRIAESKSFDAAVAYVADHRLPTAYLLLPTTGGGAAVYLGFLAHKTDTADEAFEELRSELPPDETLWIFDTCPKPVGRA